MKASEVKKISEGLSDKARKALTLIGTNGGSTLDVLKGQGVDSRTVSPLELKGYVKVNGKGGVRATGDGRKIIAALQPAAN